MTVSGFIASAIGIVALLATPADARGPWRASETNTRGWQLMTPEERVGHQARIRGFTTLAECRTYQAEHHRRMEERARLARRPLPAGGQDFCAHLKPDAASP